MPEPEHINQLIVIAGPTAVGKTKISLKLAQKYQCPIISADSRQCYRELGVATAKPSQQELKQVKHYFINSHSITDSQSAADYEQYALQALEEVFDLGNYGLLTGGSGLYINAVCKGLDPLPDVPPKLRQELEHRWRESGLQPLLQQLQELDLAYYQQVDQANPRRIIRALEVCLASGQPYSSFRHNAPKARPFNCIKILLNRDRKELYGRIDTRMEQMIDQGLFEEAEALYQYRHLGPLQTVGYQEVFAYLQGDCSKEEAVHLLKRNSRRYAKRQLTWFGNDPSYKSFHPDDYQGIQEYITERAATAI